MTKKMLVCHDDTVVFQRLLARPTAGKNVVIPCSDATEIIRVTAATEPHLVVIGRQEPGEWAQEVGRLLRTAGFRLPIVALQDGPVTDRQLDELWGALRKSRQDLSPVELDPRNYSILTEKPFESGVGDTLVTDPVTQENRLLALLAAGEHHQNRASSYLYAVIENQSRLETEATLATINNDAAAYFWRSQLFRFVSTLAHFVPGVDVACLPTPQGPSTKFDFVPNALSGEAFYALNAVRTFGINPKCHTGLWNVGQALTRNNSGLQDDAARLAGWATFMRHAACATTGTINALLNLAGRKAVSCAGDCNEKLQRAIFCQFWNLPSLQNSPDRLIVAAREFQEGRRSTGIKPFCSFFEFAERIQQKEKNKLGWN